MIDYILVSFNTQISRVGSSQPGWENSIATSGSKHSNETWNATTSLTPLCRYCDDINLEDLKSSVGYVHMPTFEALATSSKDCKLCELILNSIKRSVRRMPMLWGTGDVSKLLPHGPVRMLALSRDVDSEYWKVRKFGPVEDTLISQNVVIVLGGGPHEMKVDYSSALIELYTIEGSSAEQAGIAVGRHIDLNMVSESNIQTIQSWVDRCERWHYPCRETAAWIRKHSKAPTRLLDVRGLKENWVKLVETHGQAKEYAALSYCWGKETPKITTTKETYSGMLGGVPCRLLSRTVQDAVTVARKLGIRYLWVDALCIIQDDKEDWKTEAQKMGLIYANAYLTIAATSANGGDKGFLIAESQVTTDFRTSQGSAVQGTVHWRSYSDFVDDYGEYVINSPLLSRGWVKQERLFSRRTVDFCKKRLYFECRVACCEGSCTSEIERQNGYEFVLSLHLLSMLQESQSELPKEMWMMFFATWGTIISDYSQLELTRHNDRLYAVAGLANVAKLSIPGRYLSGIWETNLADGLLWRPKKFPMERGEDQFAPSWSWASSTQEVNVGGHSPEESCLELVKVSQGKESLERLHVHGGVHRCYVSLEPEPPRFCRSDRKFVDPPARLTEYPFAASEDASLAPGASMSDNICVFDGTRGEETEFTFLRVSCSSNMALRHCRGLLLKRVGPVHGNFYERIGVGWSSDLTWHNIEESEICLV